MYAISIGFPAMIRRRSDSVVRRAGAVPGEKN